MRCRFLAAKKKSFILLNYKRSFTSTITYFHSLVWGWIPLDSGCSQYVDEDETSPPLQSENETMPSDSGQPVPPISCYWNVQCHIHFFIRLHKTKGEEKNTQWEIIGVTQIVSLVTTRIDKGLSQKSSKIAVKLVWVDPNHKDYKIES